MEVREKNIKIWRKDIVGKNGTFYRYTVNVSKKTPEGFVRAYIPVMFSKKSGAPEVIENGTVCKELEGFMSVDSYKDRDGNERNQPMIIVMSAKFEDADSFEQIEEDIPF